MRYTVTTYRKSCPRCHAELECEVQGLYTPLLPFLFMIAFPIMISYYLLKFVAFSCPVTRKIGPKFSHCPHCLEIIKTGNCYEEELYGEYLLNHKFTPWFYVAYAFGAAFICAVLSFLGGFSVIKLMLTLIFSLAVVAIIVWYRVLLSKYKLQESSSINTMLVEKLQESELVQLYNSLHNTQSDKRTKNSEKETDTSFVANFDKKIADHKKWQEDPKQGKRLIVEDEVISGCNISGIRLQNTKFLGCTFKNMDLSNVSFRRSDLSNSKFIGCILTKADFTGAVIDNVQFKRSNTDEAIFGK